MVADPKPRILSVQEYLELEPHSPIKHDYIDGQLYAMSGGTPAHGILGANVIITLGTHLRGGPCRIYTSDVKVQLAETRYIYPDVSVSCDEHDRASVDAIRFPSLIVKILSPSTEAYDRSDKFAYCRRSASLREYVLVNAAQMSVECYRRGPEGFWTLYPFAAGDEMHLESIAFRGLVAEIYEGVSLDPETAHDTV